MAGQIRTTLARKIIGTLGEKSSAPLLEKTSWCIRCVRMAKRPSTDVSDFGVRFKDLESAGLILPGETVVQQLQAGCDLAQKIDRGDLIEDAYVKNHVLNFIVNDTLFKKEILNEILKKNVSYGFDGPQHLYKWNKVRGIEALPQNQRVVVEYGSPNIAKPFHAGHLRSTIIGQFIANLNTALGHNVTKLNYLGDWGTQYGYLGLAYERYGSEQELRTDPLAHLFNIYVQINRDSNDDPAIHEEAKKLFNKMEHSEEDDLPLWKKFRDISIKEYSQLYARLGVEYDEYHGESMYRERCRKLIDRLKEKNLLQFDPKENRGYLNLPDNSRSDSSQSHVTILKSDGSSLYLTRDVAAYLHRKEKYEFDRIHYVVGEAQTLHFKTLQEILGLIEEPVEEGNHRHMHVKFGRVTGMSTRKGEVVFLKDILDEAQNRMIHTMKTAETTKETGDVEGVADILGVSAVIVQDLKMKRGKHYPFSWDATLKFRGRTGVFLQCCHARLFNLEKNSDVPLNVECNLENLKEDISTNLVHHLARFDEFVHYSFIELEPYYIANYLFLLGTLANSAHDQLRVKSQPAHIAEARLILFHCARMVLANGMKLLGLKPLNRL